MGNPTRTTRYIDPARNHDRHMEMVNNTDARAFTAASTWCCHTGVNMILTDIEVNARYAIYYFIGVSVTDPVGGLCVFDDQ